MQIALSKYGTSLSKFGDMFEIFTEGQKHHIAPTKVSSFLISPGIKITSDAVELALKYNIDLLFLDRYGEPIGKFWHARMGSTAKIRRAQLQIMEKEEGLKLGLGWIQAKFQNQIKFLSVMRERRTRLSAEITQVIDTLEDCLKQIRHLTGNINQQRQTILGIEGSAGKVYWDIFARFVPEHFAFNGRSRQPAQDEFNAILNYGYGVLYGLVERAVIIAGLDPYLGFIHTDNYNKISLVYDVIEKYRIWVEETIIALFAKKAIRKDHFKKLANGFMLDEEGKKVFLPALNEHLDTAIHYKGRNVRRRDVMQLDLHRFAQELLEVYNESD